MMDYRENLQKNHEYVRALEEERRKVEMFQRELPLCLEIITQAIESYKQQLAERNAATTTTTTSQGSEQTTSECPGFEEFIPLKRTCSSTRENEEDEEDGDELGSHKNSVDFEDCDRKSGPEKKSDWLSSVQLWNQSPDPTSTTTTTNELPKKVAVVEVMRNGGAFHPFHKEEEKCTISDSAAMPLPPASTVSACSTAERGGRGGGEKEEEGGQQRKSRRCWSQELHKRFLNALDQLGGSHAATPKQIRDLMKVDGLTNDEVKSHLQKYRLHSRRPTTTSSVHNNGTVRSPAPQLVVVGGIWMPPPPEYTPAGIYYSVPPSPPAGQPDQQRQHQNQSSQSAGSSPGHGQGGAATGCNSPTTPSSIHTATASPTY